MNGPTGRTDPAAIAERVGDPDSTAAAAARRRLDAAETLQRTGRIGDLALWWAGVRGDDRAGPPRAVVEVCPGREPGPTDSITAAIGWGLDRVDQAVDGGADLVLLAVDDDPGARLLAAALLRLDPVQAAGWPAARGLDDETWMQEVVALRDGLRRLSGCGDDPLPLLTGAGSAALAAGFGVVLGAAARRTGVLLDGAGASVAALLARTAAPPAGQWWRLAHAGAGEPFAEVARSLHLTALLDLGLKVQDGTGARLALPMVEAAAHLLESTRDLPDDPDDPDDPDEDPGRR